MIWQEREEKWRLVWAEVDGYVSAITDEAVGFKIPNETFTLWIPISQINSVTLKNGGDVTVDDLECDDCVTHVEIPLWLAEDRGLEYED